MNRNYFINNIWCCRHRKEFFLISRVENDSGSYSWYISVLGYELWFGPDKPSFIGKTRGVRL